MNETRGSRRGQVKKALLLCALLLVASPAAADALRLPAPAIERGGPVMVKYVFDRPVSGAATLTVDWTDSYGRLVEHEVIHRNIENRLAIAFSIDLRRAVAMQNQLRATCAIVGSDTMGRQTQYQGEAAASFVARPPVRGWRNYQIVIWQPQTRARLIGLTRLGVSAGRVPGFRGPLDPAVAKRLIEPFLAVNQRWFIENIATDFYSAYHRWSLGRAVNWLFAGAKALYRLDPAGRAAFIRNPSLSDPQWLRRITARLTQHVQAYRAYRPLYYNLADEAGIADLAAAWDFDFSPVSLVGFRLWLKQQYGTLMALNREWGTAFTLWRDVMPMTTDEALKRGDGNFAAWADFKAWMETDFARAVKSGTNAVHAADPQARAALEGAQPPGSGGYNYTRLAGAVDVMEMYDHADNVAIAESLNPKLIVLSTSSLAGPEDVHNVWQQLLRGERGLILWDDHGAFVNNDGSATTRGKVLAALANQLRSGLAAQWLAAAPLASPVAIVYSPASYRTQWLLDRKAEGGDWTNRGSGTEYEADSAVRATTRLTARLLRHLGITPRWMTRRMIESGALRREGILLLMLPHTIALSQWEAAQIRDFAAHGGKVVTDTEPGLFDAHSRREPQPLLARLTNRDGSSLITPILQTASGTDDPRRLMTMSNMLTSAGVQMPVIVANSAGVAATDVDVYARRIGSMILIGLQRDGPQPGQPSPETVTLQLPRPVYISNLIQGGAPVFVDHLALSIGSEEPAMLALSPTPPTSLTISGPNGIRTGATADYQFAPQGNPPAGAQILHVVAISPKGPVEYYSGNLVLGHYGTLWSLRLAVNDPIGEWTIQVRGLLGGQTIYRNLSVVPGSSVN